VSSKSIQSRAAPLLLAVLLVGPAISDANPRDVSHARAGDLSTIRIDNFGCVNPTYYRGAEPDDQEYASLAALGIKTVVDLRSDDVDPEDRLLVERAGMKYAQIPMTTHAPPTASMVQTFLQIVTDPANQPVYVHCVGGRHRTGVMTAVCRMTQERWSAEQAFTEMKQYKFGPDFLHPEFKRFVYGYQTDRAVIAAAGG
jgi:tyrosine-protein phosphatase SIW14